MEINSNPIIEQLFIPIIFSSLGLIIILGMLVEIKLKKKKQKYDNENNI